MMNTHGSEARIRPAGPQDLPEVKELLRDAGLPTDGVADHFGEAYAVADAGGQVVAAAGVEIHDGYGLLRSVVVSPDWQGLGLGEQVVRDRLRWAEERKLRGVVLLTTTAAGYFPRLGFIPAAREDVPEAVRSSSEFTSVCPASAAVLWLNLQEA